MTLSSHLHYKLFCVYSVAVFPAVVVSEGVFLGTRDRHVSLAQVENGESNLLYDLEAAIGSDHRFATERRVSRLEEAMRPLFNVLPKNKSGRLGASGVRYMLHRLFVQRHGWFVRGLDMHNEAWNASSPTDLIGIHVGQEAQGVFDKQLNAHGFDLHHAAILAATLENFVHKESVERLEAAYRLVGLSPHSDNASEEMVSHAMKAYMMMYVLQKNYSNTTRRWVNAAFRQINKIYPTWNNTVHFLEEIRKSVVEGDSGSDNSEETSNPLPLSWNTTLKILETFGERYGRWQHGECMAMKRKLVEMEDPNTGRVPLARFYGDVADDKEWLFKESIEYLESLGVLDKSDPNSISVIIPNYLNGPNNCVAGSKFYDVCCIDECDALVSHLEHHLAASEASPERIARLVANLPSDTETVPRALPDVLLNRLEEIATHHGGSVPLHGRLFAQWMHHAYPRECTYPHMSGTLYAVNPIQFIKNGGNLTISIEQHANMPAEWGNVKDASGTHDVGEERALPWSYEEELFVYRPELSEDSKQGDATIPSAVKAVLVFALSILLVFARVRGNDKAVWSAAPDDASRHKYYV